MELDIAIFMYLVRSSQLLREVSLCSIGMMERYLIPVLIGKISTCRRLSALVNYQDRNVDSRLQVIDRYLTAQGGFDFFAERAR